jgi:hypothetical protein
MFYRRIRRGDLNKDTEFARKIPIKIGFLPRKRKDWLDIPVLTVQQTEIKWSAIK